MSLDARYIIVKSFDHSWKDLSAEIFLEVVWHIVSKLTNRMQGSVSNLRVLVFDVLHNGWNHARDFLDFIDILSYLGESHDASIFEAPVLLVGDGVLDKLSEQRKHDFLADTGCETVDAILSELNVVFFLLLLLAADRRTGVSRCSRW